MSNAVDSLAAKVSSGIRRPTFTWDIPEAARLFPGDPSSFTMVPYTVAEEMDAVKVSRATGAQLQYEFIKKAVVQINGGPVTDLDWLEKTSPTCRQLISEALDTMLLPPDTVKNDFKNSLKRGVES